MLKDRTARGLYVDTRTCAGCLFPAFRSRATKLRITSHSRREGKYIAVTMFALNKVLNLLRFSIESMSWAECAACLCRRCLLGSTQLALRHGFVCNSIFSHDYVFNQNNIKITLDSVQYSCGLSTDGWDFLDRPDVSGVLKSLEIHFTRVLGNQLCSIYPSA
jgi:hypothetical protein